MKDRRAELLIVLTALALFVPGLGSVHLFDWDEINFAEIAREMIATSDYVRPQINYLPFWEKPPLFAWLQAGSMHLFGVNEFAARLPNAMCGTITLLVLFRIGSRLRGRMFGALWVLAYLGSVLPHLYFRSGIIDPWFNLFIFLGLHAFILMCWDREDPSRRALKAAVLGGSFIGLAMLTKGPAALLIVGLTATAYWVMQRFRLFFRISHLTMAAAIMLLVCFAWFGVDWLKNGSWFTRTFITYQIRLFSTPDAGHGGFPGYHFVVLLVGCFPASLFALQEMLRPTRGDAGQNDYRRWMLILFWVVLILFTIVKSKIVHYSSMCYFPLTFLAALHLEKLWYARTHPARWLGISIGVVGSLFALATLALPLAMRDPEVIKPLFAKDPFAQANLDADVHWSGWEMLAGVWMLVVLVAGHVFFRARAYPKGILALFGGTALFVTITLFFFIRNIEAYSQRAAIEFFEQRQDEGCYVTTLGYKSYAHLFYARKPPVSDPRAHDREWLLRGGIDRPVYAVSKVTGEQEVVALGTFHEIGRKNGFVFWRRDP